MMKLLFLISIALFLLSCTPAEIPTASLLPEQQLLQNNISDVEKVSPEISIIAESEENLPEETNIPEADEYPPQFFIQDR